MVCGLHCSDCWLDWQRTFLIQRTLLVNQALTPGTAAVRLGEGCEVWQAKLR